MEFQYFIDQALDRLQGNATINQPQFLSNGFSCPYCSRGTDRLNIRGTTKNAFTGRSSRRAANARLLESCFRDFAAGEKPLSH